LRLLTVPEIELIELDSKELGLLIDISRTPKRPITSIYRRDWRGFLIRR